MNVQNHLSYALRSLVAVTFAVVVLLTACKKEEENLCFPKVSKSEINACANWFIYDAGSYWIYHDTASGMEDSVYVVSSERSVRRRQNDRNEHCSITDLQDMAVINYRSSISGAFYEVVKGNFVLTDTLVLDSVRSKYVCLSSPTYSIQLQDSTIDEVVAFQVTDSTRHYFKAGIGIVRKQTRHDSLSTTTFDLVRHKVQFSR